VSRFDPAVLPAAVANRVLGREGWARACLAVHAGRVFAVTVGPLVTSMRIDEAGMIAATPDRDGPPDLRLTISPLALPSLLAEPTRWDEFVAVDGDPALAATLKGLAETLPWFVERALAVALGPIVGQRVADAGRRLLALPGYAGARVGASIASYARDEAVFATKTAEARSIGEEILATATRVDALSRRVDAVAARIAAAPAANPPAGANS
jgi:ubiquinone biosynthesis protein UbiJ